LGPEEGKEDVKKGKKKKEERKKPLRQPRFGSYKHMSLMPNLKERRGGKTVQKRGGGGRGKKEKGGFLFLLHFIL